MQPKTTRYELEEDSGSEKNVHSPIENQTTVHFQLPSAINSAKHHDVSNCYLPKNDAL